MHLFGDDHVRTSIMERIAPSDDDWLMGTLTAPSYPALAVLACYLLGGLFSCSSRRAD